MPEKHIALAWNDATLDYPFLNRDGFRGKDYGCFIHSINVLAVANGEIHLAYLQLWTETDEETERGPDWRIAGRDSYQLDGVTHWKWLPMPP